jgi:rubredoxin-NAD+ reductase
MAAGIKPRRLIQETAIMTTYRRYQCSVCGHIYDEAEGDPDTGIKPGMLWQDIPDTWKCPDCGADKADFEPMK